MQGVKFCDLPGYFAMISNLTKSYQVHQGILYRMTSHCWQTYTSPDQAQLRFLSIALVCFSFVQQSVSESTSPLVFLCISVRISLALSNTLSIRHCSVLSKFFLLWLTLILTKVETQQQVKAKSVQETHPNSTMSSRTRSVSSTGIAWRSTFAELSPWVEILLFGDL